MKTTDQTLCPGANRTGSDLSTQTGAPTRRPPLELAPRPPPRGLLGRVRCQEASERPSRRRLTRDSAHPVPRTPGRRGDPAHQDQTRKPPALEHRPPVRCRDCPVRYRHGARVPTEYSAVVIPASVPWRLRVVRARVMRCLIFMVVFLSCSGRMVRPEVGHAGRVRPMLCSVRSGHQSFGTFCGRPRG
jgi:hypothetical protein